MLALTRKSGESIVINNDVEITVLDHVDGCGQRRSYRSF